MAPMKSTLAGAVLALALGALACGAPAGNPPARDSIASAQRAQAGKRSYVVNSTLTLDTGVSANALLAYVAPDRYHSSDLDGPMMQVIRIGERGWMRAGDDPWQPQIVDTAAALRRLRGPVAIDEAGYQLQSAQSLGPGNHPREPTALYEYVVTRDAETARVKMWVSNATGLPISYEAEVTNGTSREKATWHIQYDDTITVEPPSGS
jgi:hypothetical protein